MPEDKWKHREEGMLCKSCMFFVPKVAKNKSKKVGRCRRNAPTMSGYPVVFDTDWCGRHKLDENSV